MSQFQLITADPPWQYNNKATNGAANDHYDTMTLDQMKRLPVAEIAAKDSVLAMWYTSGHIREAYALAEAWGFKVKTIKLFTWVKLNKLAQQHIDKHIRKNGRPGSFDEIMELLRWQTRMNGGNYTRANTEDMLVAVRGKGLKRHQANIKQVIYAPVSEHSAKPIEHMECLEELYGDVERLEMFARTARKGWSNWGNQAPMGLDLMPVPANDNQPAPAAAKEHK